MCCNQDRFGCCCCWCKESTQRECTTRVRSSVNCQRSHHVRTFGWTIIISICIHWAAVPSAAAASFVLPIDAHYFFWQKVFSSFSLSFSHFFIGPGACLSLSHCSLLRSCFQLFLLTALLSSLSPRSRETFYLQTTAQKNSRKTVKWSRKTREKERERAASRLALIRRRHSEAILELLTKCCWSWWCKLPVSEFD